MPSPCAAPTSAPCFSSVRTASRSPRIAASATGVDDGAAASHAVVSSARDNVSPNQRFILVFVMATLEPLPLRHLTQRPQRPQRALRQNLLCGLSGLCVLDYATVVVAGD